MYSGLPDEIVCLFVLFDNNIYNLFSILLSPSRKSVPDVSLRRTQ